MFSQFSACLRSSLELLLDENPRKKVRGMLVAIFGVVPFLSGLDASHSSLASESIRVFNVEVYLDREPPCRTTDSKAIVVTVSPFKEQVYLGDVIAELARQAAQAGATIVYGIKLSSFIPNEGAVATAMTSSCQEPVPPSSNISVLPFDARLISILTRGSDVRGYSVANALPHAVRSVANSNLVRRQFKVPSNISQLRQIILSRDTYDTSPGLRKSCPFIPSLAFEFRSDDNSSAWWLVSESCQTATLVFQDEDWRRSDQLNLRSTSVSAFRNLLDGPDQKN